eukprot:m.14233 g.14233  ORF g.14233 m.14233 type:complete len:707 (-) comp6166_c0_seq1:126-2246(-)
MSTITQAPLGVRLSVVVELHIAAQASGCQTTSDACAGFVVPTTKALGVSYVEYLQHKLSADEYTELVQPATVFVSHAWRYHLSQTVDAMRQYEEKHPNSYFWFDLVMNSQHQTADRPFEWWCTTFRESIGRIGKMILVIAPWSCPIPLTRAWCLFEIISAITSGAQFEIWLPSQERQQFIQDLRQSASVAVAALVNIEAEQSQAVSPIDRDMIFKAIEATVGFDKLNQTVKQQIREWFVATATDFVSTSETQCARPLSSCSEGAFVDGARYDIDHKLAVESQLDKLYIRVATMLRSFGAYESVDAMLQKAERLLETAPDAFSNDTMGELKVQQGELAKDRGELERASECFSEAKTLFFQGAPDTSIAKVLGIQTKLTNLMRMEAKYDEAKHGFEAVIEAYKLQLTEESTASLELDLAEVYMSYGSMCNYLGDFDKAVENFSCNLEIVHKHHSKNHPMAAATYCTLGEVNTRLTKFDEAERNYNAALHICLASFGVNHKETARVYQGLALLHRAQEDYLKAIEYYLKALPIYEHVFGDMSSRCAEVYHHLGRTYMMQENHEGGLKYLKMAFDIGVIQFGADHPRIAGSHNSMGKCLRGLGRYAEAIEQFQHAIDIRVAKIGFHFQGTGDSLSNIGITYELMGDMEKSLEYRERALEALNGAPNSPNVQLLIDTCTAAIQRLKGSEPNCDSKVDEPPRSSSWSLCILI